MNARCSQGCPDVRPPLGKLGRGSNVVFYCRHSHGSGMSSAETYARAEVVVDVASIPWDEACTLSISGPMVDPFLPPGTVRGFGTPKPWVDEPRPSFSYCATCLNRECSGFFGEHARDEKRSNPDPRFGSAGPIDEVALDVYLKIAGRFGAPIWRRGEPIPAEVPA